MWDEFFSHHKVGDIVEGKIVRLTNFGAFVELAEGIEGLVHVSELDEKRIEKPEEAFKPGDVFPMKIIKIQEGEKKIGLSIKAVKQDDKIELRGFGSFRIRRRDSRPGRNPKTGAGVLVPAKKVPHFKPGKELRELINRR